MGDDVDITALRPADVEKLKRPQLQRLCKQLGLRAGGKNVELIAELRKHCGAASSASNKAGPSKPSIASPVQLPKVGRGSRKRKADLLTPPDSPRSATPEPAGSAKKAKRVSTPASTSKEKRLSTSASPGPAKVQKKAPRGKRKQGGKKGKQAVSQNAAKGTLSPVKVAASPLHKNTPSKSPKTGKKARVSTPGAGVADVTKPVSPRVVVGKLKASKRGHDDLSPPPLAKRRKIAESPAAGPSVSTTRRQSSPKRKSTTSSGRSSSRKSSNVTSPAKLSSPKGRPSTSSSSSTKKRSSGQQSRLSSAKKRSSPAKSRPSVGSAKKRTSAKQSLEKATPPRRRTSKQSAGKSTSPSRRPSRSKKSPAHSSPEFIGKGKFEKSPTASGSPNRRLTFTRKPSSPSPGPSKDELKASLLAELDVRVATKIPAPAGGGTTATGSKIPRFPTSAASQQAGKNTSGKDWGKIHKNTFNKMKSIADVHAEKQRRVEAATKPTAKMSTLKTPGAVRFGSNVPDGRPKSATRVSMACARPGGISRTDGHRKTPSRPSMPAAGPKPTVFKPPTNVSTMSFNFSSKTPAKTAASTNTPGKTGGKGTPFRFGATPSKSQTTTPKPKFDLKASLQRPLTYKPHTGPLNLFGPSHKTTAATTAAAKKPSGIPRRASFKQHVAKSSASLRAENRAAVQQRQKSRRDDNLLARRGLA